MASKRREQKQQEIKLESPEETTAFLVQHYCEQMRNMYVQMPLSSPFLRVSFAVRT